MRPRHVERLYSAVPTEPVFGDTRIECVGLKITLTLQKMKILPRNEKMQESRHAANTAITVRDFQFGWCLDFEANATTMAATFMSSHG